jgi:hypothetical protein
MLDGIRMKNERELEIRTIIVDGNYESFKAALARSILGVTYRRFKRKGKEFYQHRKHNESVTKRICDWFYEYLRSKTPLRNISDYKIKTNLTLRWDRTGKILGFKNATVTIYLKVGELKVEELKIHKKREKVKIDLFYSEIDVSSQKIRELLPNILKTLGEEHFDYREYDFLSEEGREMAKIYSVERVPTVVIDNITLENPDEKKLRSEIENAFTLSVLSSGVEFQLEPKIGDVIKPILKI